MKAAFIYRLFLLIGLLIAQVMISYGQSSDTARLNRSSGINEREVILENDLVDSATVYISFIVETSGKITNVKVSKIKCKPCSKEFKGSLKTEAIRVISSMPAWPPTKERRKYIQPLKFEITD